MRLADKTALITGAARGIGRAFAEAYIREGARVAIADIDQARAARTASDLGEAAMPILMDVTDQMDKECERSSLSRIVPWSGPIFLHFGYETLFGSAIGLHVLCLVYAIFTVKDSRKIKAKKVRCLKIQHYLHHCIEMTY